MQHVTGLDQMFLSYDTMTTNGNIGGIAIFDDDGKGGPKAEPGARLAWLRQRVTDRLPTLPPLRWRLAPFAMDTFWVESTVDVDYHVVHVQLQEPGDEKTLLTYLKRIMGVHLDRTRPMWRLYLIEGLPNGQYAYLFKVHHGLADGSAMWEILDHLADHPVTNPEVSEVAPEGPAEIIAGGMKNYLDKPMALAALQANIGKWLAERVAEEEVGAIPAMMARLIPGEMALPFVAFANAIRNQRVPEIASQRPVLVPPPSPFNGTTTRNVEIALVDFALEDLRRAGKAAGGTINDAVLAITAGALRTYMERHGINTSLPLLASAPVSWRTGTEKERWANQIWMLFLQLPTHITDPVERLHWAHKSATLAKDNWDRMPLHMLREASALMPGAMMASMGPMMAGMPAEMMPAIYNVAVSNVKGPRERPEFGGNPMARYFVFGFLAPTTGLLVGGQSLGDRMIFSLTACRDIVKHLDTLPKLFHDSLAELLKATNSAPADSAKASKAATPAKA
jgi:diacylglycerol O-acyltransferase